MFECLNGGRYPVTMVMAVAWLALLAELMMEGADAVRALAFQSLYNNHYITIRLGVAGGLSQATCHPLTESRLFYIYY
jgi:hypothetical protein